MHMPSIGTVLKEEISRLSRKEVRSQIEATKKATTQHRRHIAALKRQVAQLERQVASLARRSREAAPAAPASAAERPRFVARGLRSQRNRLGLSATDYGKLLGVSAQSIYNWERELSHPRDGQLAGLAALRGIGKREAAERLRKLQSGKTATRGRKTDAGAA
jgi:DNA-binding transcriptional regulator YiaG